MIMWLYIAAGVISTYLLIYMAVCFLWIIQMREVATILREILDGQWGDVMKQLVNEEYVEAVIRACKMVMEEAR